MVNLWFSEWVMINEARRPMEGWKEGTQGVDAVPCLARLASSCDKRC